MMETKRQNNDLFSIELNHPQYAAFSLVIQDLHNLKESFTHAAFWEGLAMEINNRMNISTNGYSSFIDQIFNSLIRDLWSVVSEDNNINRMKLAAIYGYLKTYQYRGNKTNVQPQLETLIKSLQSLIQICEKLSAKNILTLRTRFSSELEGRKGKAHSGEVSGNQRHSSPSFLES